MMGTFARWWFQMFFLFTPIWGRFPFWRIFFKRVETTNQFGFLADAWMEVYQKIPSNNRERSKELVPGFDQHILALPSCYCWWSRNCYDSLYFLISFFVGSSLEAPNCQQNHWAGCSYSMRWMDRGSKCSNCRCVFIIKLTFFQVSEFQSTKGPLEDKQLDHFLVNLCFILSYTRTTPLNLVGFCSCNSPKV